MFSFLRRGPRARRDPDRVFMTRRAKLEALVSAGEVRIVAHFAETRRALQDLARERGRTIQVVLSAGLVPPPGPDPSLRVVVAERHLLREHDDRVAAWADAAAGSLGFYLSFDDPVIAAFVDEEAKALFQRLGLGPDEPIESALVARAIQGAQARVRKAAASDLPADSAEGWMRANGLG
jgi:preprotein translocase subunit SecA